MGDEEGYLVIGGRRILVRKSKRLKRVAVQSVPGKRENPFDFACSGCETCCVALRDPRRFRYRLYQGCRCLDLVWD
eukprot:3096423-Rhodomonas_salina.1